jgi:hypothetical protein
LPPDALIVADVSVIENPLDNKYTDEYEPSDDDKSAHNVGIDDVFAG